MIGYYLFVCMIYVIVIFLVYMGHCCYYSIEIFVVDYDSYHCLLLMLYVLGLATVDLCCYAFHAITHCYYYVHIIWFSRFVLFVLMTSYYYWYTYHRIC